MFTSEMTTTLILPLLILLNDQDQVPCNTFISFVIGRFQPLGGFIGLPSRK
jgi:hypothetical protein